MLLPSGMWTEVAQFSPDSVSEIGGYSSNSIRPGVVFGFPVREYFVGLGLDIGDYAYFIRFHCDGRVCGRETKGETY